MARYVLVEFDDNEEANNFVGMLRGGDFDGRPAEVSPDGSVRVVGMFFKPTQFCECPQGEQTARGKKYGLQVHSCGKPIRGRWQHPRNLVKEDDKTLYEQGLYLGIVEPQDGEMPSVDFRERGKALGLTRR